jgi:hypothetical protein
MKKAIIAAVAGLVLVGSGAVYAQHRHQHPRFTAQDKAAFVEARIAAVHAGLQLTPDQEKNWPPVETAVRDFAKQRIDRAEARRAEREARRDARERGDQTAQNDRKDYDPIARLQKRADTMAATAAGLKRIAEAADPLYKSLDDAQKRRLAVLTHMNKHHGWGERRGSEGGGDRHGSYQDNDHGPDHDHESGPGGSERL